MLATRLLRLACSSFVCLALSSCTPLRDPGVEVPGFSDMSPLTQPCEKGLLRCTSEGDRVEECDGRRWVVQKSCDITSGATCKRGRCVGPCDDLPTGSTGCSFYVANLWSTANFGQFGIVATNTSSERAAEVTLGDANGVIQTQTAPPGGLVVFRLEHGRNKLSMTEHAKKAFHLLSSAPVAAYLFHPIDAASVYTGSASLLLPEHVMAKDYFAVSYTYNAGISTMPPQGQGFVAVLALSDNTEVKVTVPVRTLAGAGTPPVPAIPAGGTLTRTMNRFDVLEIAQASSLEDISGAQVKASANVVVFGGAGGVTIPYNAPGGDHLGTQMFPLTTWGKHYAATKFKPRGSSDRDYYRVLASVDNTRITFAGTGTLPGPQTLNRGAFFEFSTASDFEITADQPILVNQYLPAWGALSGNFNRADFPEGSPSPCPYFGDSAQCLGDANMAPLAPIEQYLRDYIFYVPQTYAYDFINVTAPLGTTLTLDGMGVTEVLRPIGAGPLGRLILRVRPGSHRIAGDMPFGLLGYGYSYATSYTYVAGLNLESINPIPGIAAPAAPRPNR